VEVNFTIVDAPLEITAYNPAENATDVALNAPVSVTFNRNPHIIDTGGGGFPPIFFSATDDEPAVVTIKVKETGEPVADVVASVALFSNILAIDHASFAYGTEYEVNVPAGVVIEADDYADAITWSFTTIAVLEVTERVPADNSTVDLDGIDFEGSIQAKFNRAITLGDTATIKATVNAVPYSVTRQNQNKDLKINVPEGYFMPSTTYTVVIPAGIITEIDTDITWTFTTAPAVAVVAQTPAPRAEGVALNAEVSVEFSKNVRIPMAGVVPTATITAGDITVGNVTYDVDESGRKFVLAHDDFEFLTTYTVTIPDGMLTTYHEAITWSFTTVDDVAIKKVSDKPSVYPTLSKGKVTVNSAPESIVSVTDVYGKTLAIYQSTGELKLDLNYANGVYLIVINDGKIATHKVILQR
jgi:hypothetical protein